MSLTYHHSLHIKPTLGGPNGHHRSMIAKRDRLG
jgi:hypothetical protein